jgi:ribonuclease-3
MNKELLKNIFDKYQINPKSYSIYEQAFTHRSYAYEKNLNYSNEKLEFLGDAVIKKVLTEYLYRKNTDENEGDLTRNRIMIEQSKTLAKASKDLGLGKILNLGGSFTYTDPTDKMLEDAFEAFMGAVYLDQGEVVVRRIIMDTIVKYFENNDLQEMIDYKSMLNKMMGKLKRKLRYKSREIENGFEVSLFVDGIKTAVTKAAKTIDAEQSAAKEVYLELTK